MFSIVIWCALSFESIWLYVRLIFFMFWGKITYFIKKNPILGDLTALYSMAYLYMLFLLDFYWWFLLMGYFRTILA